MQDQDENKLPGHDGGTNHEHGTHDDVPALALGALDSTEENAVLGALHTSEDARRELRTLEEVVGELGLATERVAPPIGLRDKILNATATPQPVSITRERNRRESLAFRIGALAAALLILVLGGIAFSQWSTAQDRQDEIDTLAAQIESQDERIAELEVAATAAGAFVNFEEPLIWTQLESTSDDGTSPGFMARTADGQTAYLVITGLQVDAEHVFQAWLIEDTPVPVGTLRPSESGQGFLIIESTGEPVQDFSLIGVTIEPPGGSPQPTTDPVIVAEIV